jgi:hypothetical protein
MCEQMYRRLTVKDGYYSGIYSDEETVTEKFVRVGAFELGFFHMEKAYDIGAGDPDDPNLSDTV